MKKKSITRNYLYNVAYEMLAIIIPLITTPYVSRVLGAEKIGIYSYTLSIVTYFVLFGSLGVAMYGKREIAYFQRDIQNRSKVFYEIFLLRLITLSLSMIVFYFTFCMNGNYSLYYKILLLEIFSNIINISWFFQGLEEFKKTVIRNAFVKIISTILIFLFVKTQSDLWKYFLIYLLSNLFGNASLWLYLPRYIVKQKVKNLNLLKHLKPTFILFIPQIATQVYTLFDRTMIGIIVLDKSEVGYYEQAQKVIKLLLTIATSLGTVMMPRIAATFAEGNNKKIMNYMSKSFSFILMLSFPLMFGICSITQHFVPIFYGNGFDKVKVLICLISPILVLVGLSNVTGTQYLLPTKQQNKYTLSVVVGATVNFILNFFLINKYGAIGASIATVIAEIAVTVTQFVLVRNQIKIVDVLINSCKFFIASIIMFTISFFIGSVIKNDLLSIIIQIFISCVVYFSILVLMKEKTLLIVIKKIKSKFV